MYKKNTTISILRWDVCWYYIMWSDVRCKACALYVQKQGFSEVIWCNMGDCCWKYFKFSMHSLLNQVLVVPCSETIFCCQIFTVPIFCYMMSYGVTTHSLRSQDLVEHLCYTYLFPSHSRKRLEFLHGIFPLKKYPLFTSFLHIPPSAYRNLASGSTIVLKKLWPKLPLISTLTNPTDITVILSIGLESQH